MKPLALNVEHRQPSAEQGLAGCRPRWGLLLRLAMADLWHERGLTFCLIFALAAVISPLLILMGIKHGLVATLRDRLVNDPRNREILPINTQPWKPEQFEEWRNRPDVAFLTPMTRRLSASIRVGVENSPLEAMEEADVIPSGPGDPLLVENGASVPASGTCVLSMPLYQHFQQDGLSTVTIAVSRQTGGKIESSFTTLRVAGVAAERAMPNAAVFTELAFLDAIERYRNGEPVPEYGWPGAPSAVLPVYDGVLFTVTEPLSDSEQKGLLVNTGFSSIESAAGESRGQQRWILKASGNGDSPVDKDTLTALRRRLPPTAGNISAWVDPIGAVITLSANNAPVGGGPLLLQCLESNIPLPTTSKAPPPILQPKSAVAPPPLAVPVAPPASALAAPARMAPPPVVLPERVRPRPVVPAQTKPGGNSSPRKPAGEGDSKTSPAKKNHPTKDGGEGMQGGSTTSSLFIPLAIRLISNLQEDSPTQKPEIRGAQPPAAPSRPEKRKSVPQFPGRSGPENKALGQPPPAADNSTPPLKQPLPRESSSPAVSEKAKTVPVPDIPAASPDPRTVFLPAAWKIKPGEALRLSISTPFGPLDFPAVSAHTDDQHPSIPLALAGVLRAARDTPVRYDDSTGAFHLTRSGYPAFRLFARTIDDVPVLADYFKFQGVSVATKAARIRDVRELDRYATYVFSLIAVVCLVGAGGVLLASLIAAVERKRRSLGVMRLLGMRRSTLVRLPIYQSITVVFLSAAFSAAVYFWISGIISGFTRRYLEAGETLALLPLRDLAWAGATALMLAVAAALVAGVRVLRVDPAEAIRDD
jgi:hypothetical protein